MANNRKSGSPQTPTIHMLRRTLFLLIVCGIVAFIVLGIKLYQIQIVHHDEYESAAIEQQVRDTTVTASRGTIYDRNKKILAMSASVENIYISPVEINMYGEDVDFIALWLSSILGVDYDSIVEKAQDSKSWYKTISSKVEQDVADQVREFKNTYNIKGVKIEADTKRYYPYSSLCAHVIGFVGTDNYGLGGIESKYNEELTGENGRIVRAKNSAGTDMLFTNFEDYYDAENGNDIVLTIDTTVQYYLEKHLRQAVADYQVQNGAAGIVMDVNTGEILAMASLDDFDLNSFLDVSDEVQAIIDEAETNEEKSSILYNAQQKQWRNKAVSDTYEPGSTFKIITMAMALDLGIVNENDHFYCGGSVGVTGREADNPVNCWKKAGHGDQTLAQALQHSCNVAFVNIGLKVGAENFYKYAEAFGFFDAASTGSAQQSGSTGIDLPGEASSIWWSRDTFLNPDNKSQLAAASFGQTFNITPLQLITAVSACANGGYLMEPHIVKQECSADGEVIREVKPEVKRQVISEETSEKVCAMLERVVGDNVEGTGKNAYVTGYRVGGKTGTSTNTVLEASTGEKQYIVSFIGVAPTDEPQIAVLVLLDCPSKDSGIYISGGQMAAPTVGKIMADVLPYIGVEAVYTDEELETMDKTVPNLTGLPVSQAIAALAEQNLSYRVIGSDSDDAIITKQLPRYNSVIASKSQVILYVDAEPSDEIEEMPDLTGLSYNVARQRLGFYGLFIRSDGGAIYDSEYLQVQGQSIQPGEEVEHGTVVIVSLVNNNESDYGRY